jgi:hypothetical protein
MILGSIMATTAAGLIYTLSEVSRPAEWIGYQILAGLGIGLCFQAPIMAGQALAEPKAVPVVTALLMFSQTLGGALTVSASQAAFGNELLASLRKNASGVSPSQILAMGATEVWGLHPNEISQVVRAYMDGLQVSFIFVIGLFGVSVLASLWTPWTNIKKNTKATSGKEG